MFSYILIASTLLSGLAKEPIQFSDATFPVEKEASIGMLTTFSTKRFLDSYAKVGYEYIDRIPKFMRRPFEKTYGLLLDHVQTAPELYLTKFQTGEYTDRKIPFIPYGQTKNGCVETAIAMLLKNNGYPTSLGQIDTQFSFYSGLSGIPVMELRRRGYNAAMGFGSQETLRYYISKGYPVMVSVDFDPNKFGKHAGVINGNFSNNYMISNVYTGRNSGKNMQSGYSYIDYYWKNASNFMIVSSKFRNQTTQEFFEKNSLRREDRIYGGFSISDFWTSGKYTFAEIAYKDEIFGIDILGKLHGVFGYKNGIGGNVKISYTYDNTKISVYFENLPFVEYKNIPGAVYVDFSAGNFKFIGGFDGKALQGRLEYNISKNCGIELVASYGRGEQYIHRSNIYYFKLYGASKEIEVGNFNIGIFGSL